MDIQNYRIEINARVSGKDAGELAEALGTVFRDADIETQVDQPQIYQKSLEPISVILYIGEKFPDVIAGYLAGRFIFDPTLKKTQAILENWRTTVAQKRNPLRPLHISILFSENTFEIRTYPYLLSQPHIENFFENSDKSLLLLQKNGLLRQVNHIRFISETIDKVSIVVYARAESNNRPTHIVDLENQAVIPLSDQQTEQYSDPNDDFQRTMQYTMLRSKLYQEMIEKLKNR